MLKSKQFIEAVKTAVIVFLFASAVFLGGKSGVFSEFLSSVPVFASTGDWISSLLHHGENREEPFKDSLQLQQAAYPSGIVLTFDDSGHYGVKYDNTRLTELYGKVSNLLGESLGSASVPAEINEQQWRAALNSPGIFLEFHTDIPLSVLVRWLGQNIRNENIHSTRRICLALAQGEENAVELFYIGSGGKFYRCRTAAKLNSVLTSLEAYTPNGAEYAYEYRTDLKMLDPYTVLLRESPEKLLIESQSLLYVSTPLESILSAVSFNPKSVNFYDTEDTRVYVEDSGKLKITAQDQIAFSASADTRLLKILYVGAQPDTGEMIEGARQLLQRIRGSSSGDEELQFTDIRYKAGGAEAEIVFNYFVNGIRVVIPGNDAAVVTVKEGFVTDFRLLLRGYSLTDTAEPLIPDYQAAAIAQKLSPGCELCLIYTDTGGDFAAPKWIVREKISGLA
jgi:hypothetical protein